MDKYAPLWEPLQVGPVTLKNRVVVTPHALQYAEHNLMTQQSVDYYEERAKGGAGLIFTEAQAVHPTSAGLAPRTTQGWKTEVIPVYERLAKAVHKYGAKVFVDLSHFGVEDYNTMHLESWRALWSPSGLPSTTYNEIGRAMTHDDIAELVAAFARTARNAQVAGLDGAEVHAAHGYLLCSFLSPLTNIRTDEYGGSTQNRCRIVIECARAVREQCGSDFAVGVRLSMTEYAPGGIDADEGERIVKILANSAIFDYLSISAGNASSFDHVVSPMSIPGTPLVELAARAKKAAGGLPVLTANGVTELSVAADIIAEGKADLVAMTRAHIADPHLVNKALAGREGEIRHCVGANQGCINRMAKGWSLTCTQNPAAGREKTLGLGTLKLSEKPKKVVVIGGGPAGMRAAETAASRGHNVILLEKEDRLGGQIKYAARLATRGRWAVMIHDMERKLELYNVDVRTGVDATIDLLRELEPDHVVLATGSTWRTDGYSVKLAGRPGIPGLDQVRVLDPIEAIVYPERCGDRVLIVDDTGDYLALGLAETLAKQGKSVEVVTAGLFAGENILYTLDIGHLYPRLYAAGVTVTAQHIIAEVNSEGAVVTRIWDGASRSTPVDSIVTVMLRDPETALLASLQAEFDVSVVGDVLAPRRVDEAIYEGEMAGRGI
ncbi:FAD-dependent oxidoreductase [Subtercola frigoramans]|uniref:2,4-dienoyl-CoA reductase-like NADH-dependent reductase (Old Yellow Enzyme family) n=2 Tax=Subtercola frigoramans TaxID=120298 RepID=A0ABS2L733_9MICO|nr:FAD-dependent oxidoreductase [Subtercola frigoramans]MBM7472882.1 2,4-dienoyl-CoA reductase-like NADH-dependent reductase (Old Yellow Enzyme family) [Subtercola frigoramans]